MSNETGNTLPDSEMETLRTCQDCGTVMPASHTGSICPKCGLGLAAESPAAQLGEAEGDVIGPYTLRQKIGEGGFGVVWMAEQSQPIQRMVALKVVKAGMDTKQVLARFEAEQQALALLDHPNIAKVLDAGATETGRPYFVMELVKGIPITQFCQEQKLATKARLDLFRDVCSAINHAHQKGIIHRDLKPSNVMVTLHGDKPVAKIIDFGIAKATQQKLTDKTLFTRFEQFLGTPVYMSPEQAALSGLDIDTRSDIYSLGVLLYELLAGKPPFDPKTLLSKGYEEMRRIIREEEPPKPSTKLTETQSSIGNQSVNVSPSALKGELDWIIMKAIDKDRGRRYETANAFAADIGRYLENEPVFAAAPSTIYKFRKFARRNKVASGVAAMLAAVLLGVTGVCVWQTHLKQQAASLAGQRLEESKKARLDADRARKEAEGVSSYFTNLLEDANAINTSEGRSVTVTAILDEAVKKLGTGLADQPAQQAKLQATIGGTYRALGLSQKAIPLEEQALAYHRTHSGLEHLSTIWAMHSLASSYSLDGRLNEALEMREEVSELLRNTFSLEHNGTLNAINNLGNSYSNAGRYDEALVLREELLRLRLKVTGPEHPDTLRAMANLANSYTHASRHDEALELREQVLTLRTRKLGREHPETISSMKNLARSYGEARRTDEALALQEMALNLSRRTLGTEHPDTLSAMNNLALFYVSAGRHEEALAMRAETLGLRRTTLGLEHPETLRSMYNLANSYSDAGRNEEALVIREEAQKLFLRIFGPEHPNTHGAINNLALSYAKCKDVDRRIEGYRYLISLAPNRSDFHGQLGKQLFHAGRHHEAIVPLQSALALDSNGSRSFHTRVCLIRALQEADRHREATEVNAGLAYVPRTLDQSAPKVLETLVSPEAEWRWLHPTDGVDPESAIPQFHKSFSLPNFDDSSWNSGHGGKDISGGFGYGENWFTGVDIGTPRGGNRYSAYFRCRFSTSLPCSHVELRCQRDDGVIVYLDGREVARDNMPTDANAYRLCALDTQEHALDSVHSHEQQVYRVPLRGGIEAGEHLLAISLHNRHAGSSDLRIGSISLVAVEPVSDATLAEASEKVLSDYRRNLSESTKRLGAEHPEKVYGRFMRSFDLASEGRHREALTEAEWAHSQLLKTLGAEHPKMINVLWALSRHYRTLGMSDKALNAGAECQSLATRIYGPGHSTTRMITWDYAVSCFVYNRDAESRSLIQEAVEAYHQAGDPTTLRVMGVMADHHEASQDINTRIIGYQRLLELEPEDPEFQYHLGKQLFDAKRFEEALPLLQSAISRYPSGKRGLDISVRLVLALSELDRDLEAETVRESLVQYRSILTKHSGQPSAQSTVIVPPTAVWRWLHPIDGVDPKGVDADFHQTFFDLDYDDSFWALGRDRPGPTGGFGYGNPWFDGVDIGSPDKREFGRSAYFRTYFTTKESYSHFELQCQRDDGVIIYLDGKEVGRDNMLSGVEAYDLSAADTYTNEQKSVRIPLTGTVPVGKHILAISLHSAERGEDLRIGEISLKAFPAVDINEGDLWSRAKAQFDYNRLREFIDRAAQRHDFDEALTQLQRQSEIGDLAEEEDRFRLAAVFAVLGERERYEALLRKTILSLDPSDELLVKLTCALPIRARKEEQWHAWRLRAHKTATELTDKGKHPNDQHSLWRGMAAYRLGENAEAKRWIDEAVKAQSSEPHAHFFALCHAYGALAYYQLGQTEDARLALQEGVSRLPPMRKYADWWDTVFAYLALREAWDLIEGKGKQSEMLANWEK